MQELSIRPATIDDCSTVSGCVNAAYTKYIERMGKKPAPMLADYQGLIYAGLVSVLLVGSSIQGVLVMEPKKDHLFIESIAVNPCHQGKGMGKRLIRFAEDFAEKHELKEIRLYTNEVMTENMGFYFSLGFEETDRRVDCGYRRVFLRKILR